MIKPIYRCNTTHSMFLRIIDNTIVRVNMIELSNGNKTTHIDEQTNIDDDTIKHLISTTIECSDDTYKLMKRTVMFNIDEIL